MDNKFKRIWEEIFVA